MDALTLGMLGTLALGAGPGATSAGLGGLLVVIVAVLCCGLPAVLLMLTSRRHEPPDEPDSGSPSPL